MDEKEVNEEDKHKIEIYGEAKEEVDGEDTKCITEEGKENMVTKIKQFQKNK